MSWYRKKSIKRCFSLLFSLLLVISLFLPQSSYAEESVSENGTINDQELEKIREQQFEQNLPESNAEKDLTDELPSLLKGLGFEVPSLKDQPKSTTADKQIVEEDVLNKLKKEDKVNVIIRMKERPNLEELYPQVKAKQKRSEKISFIQEHLKQKATNSQKGINQAIQALENKGKAKKKDDLWIINAITASLSKEALDELKTRDDIESITLDHVLSLPEVKVEESKPKLPQWGLEKIHAPQVWGDYGLKGEGVVVGIMDSGVDGSHEALKNNYRGRDGNHQYSWIDLSGEGYKTPHDGNGHGTHVAGTAVGGGEGEAVGVAPEAEWIAAKIFNDGGSTTLSAIHKAFEWFMAPGGDPTKAPQVVNNSWGNSNAYNTEFYEDVEAWVSSGIFPLFAAGNDGPGSQTIGSPGSFPSAFAVGATDVYDQIAYFSSRGPVFWTDENGNQKRILKPDIAAPGYHIYSAWPTQLGEGKYVTISGTSMATPHVAGAIALLYQANPNITIDEVKDLLRNTARTEAHMGNLPNDVYGNGIVDIYQAVTEAAFAGELTGTLTNRDGQPITGTIHFVDNKKDYEVNEDGNFTYKIREGSHKVVVDSFGYNSLETTITITKGKTTSVAWKLERANSYHVAGQVIDKETNVGIPYAYIRVKGTPLASVRTDATGNFTIDNLPVGNYVLQVTGEGIIGVTTDLNLDSDQNLKIEVEKTASTFNPDWRTANNNNQRNAITSVGIDIENLKEGWKYETGSKGEILFSTPAVAENRVLLTTERGWIVSLDAETGKELWSIRLGSSNRSSPTIEDGVAYLAGGTDGRVYAIELDSGRILWSYDTGSMPIYEAPLYYNGNIYVGSGLDENAALTALNSKTGGKIWSTPLNASTFFGGSIGDGILYVGSYDNQTLRAVNLEDGSVVWSKQLTNEGFASLPVYKDGSLYVIGTNFDDATGSLYALDANTGEERWKVGNIGDTQAGTAIVYEDLVIIGSASMPVLRAFDRATGTLKWENNAVGTSYHNGTVTANGILFVSNMNGSLFAIDVYTGQSLKEFTLPTYSTSGIPITAGKVYVPYLDGIQLYESPGSLVGTLVDEDGNPVEGKISVVETGTEVVSGADGTFKLLHNPGEFTVKVAKYGKKQIVEKIRFISGYEHTKKYTLQNAESGSLKLQVIDKRTKAILSDVNVALEDTTVAGKTNENGFFNETNVYEGAYNLTLSLDGYMEAKQQIVVKPGEVTNIVVEMQPIDIAVLNDWHSEVTTFLKTNGYSVEERDWSVVDNIDRYQVIYLNGAYGSDGEQPTEEAFRHLVDVAREHNVSIIFADQWGSSYGSIEHLHDYFNDPKNFNHAYNNGLVRMQVDVEHPIFKGYKVGDRLSLYERSGDFTWFNQYSGRNLGSVGDTTLGFVGTGVAYKAVSEGSAHLLLSTHAAAPWVSPMQGWLPDQQQILFNSLDYLMGVKFGAVTGSITNTAGEAVKADIEVVETGVKVQANDEGKYELFHDEGTYTLEIRAAGYGTQKVEVTFTNGEPSVTNITLQTTDGGALSGLVTDANSEQIISGAKVELVDDAGEMVGETTTGTNGRYTITGLEDKTYTLHVSKEGYIKSTQSIDVGSIQGDLNIALYSVPRIAVIGDYYSDERNFQSIFKSIGVDVTELSIKDLTNRMNEFDVVFYNDDSSTKTEFDAMLKAADENQTSIIFGDVYWSGSGVDELVKHRKDPKNRGTVRSSTKAAGYVVMEEHPIFQNAKVGDFLELLTPSSSAVGYFNDYSGYPLASLKLEGDSDALGLGMAYKPRTAGSVEVLMSAHGFVFYHDADDYTEQGKEILRQTVLWAANAKFPTINGTVTDPDGNPLEAEVKVSGEQFTTKSDPETGAFSIAIKDGEYQLEISAYGYETQTLQVMAAENYDVKLKIDETVASISGLIENEIDGNVVDGAHIKVLEAPREATTDKLGKYQINRLLPGSYTLRVEKDGYILRDVKVDLAANENLQLDIKVKPSPTIGVIGEINTSDTGVKEYLENRGYKVIYMTFKDIDLLDKVDLVFANSDYNNSLIPTKEEFDAFQKALDKTRTSVIWTGQDGGRGSIRYLNDYEHDPATVFSGDEVGSKGKILENHPITEGLELGTEFDVPARFDYYYGFDGYSGKSLVSFTQETTGEKGSMVAYKGRTTDSVEILLANMTFSHVYNPDRAEFDPVREKILNNAIQWAIFNEESIAGELHGQITNNLGLNTPATITVKETGKTYKTDSDGKFFIGLEEGNYELFVEAFGHQKQTFNIAMKNGEQLEKTFTITAENVGTVTGQVIAGDTNEPIAGAMYQVIGTPIKGVTDEKGGFTASLPAGEYEVRVIASGYAPINHPGVIVNEGENTVLKLTMQTSQKIAVMTSSYNKNKLVPFIEQYGYDVEHFVSSDYAKLQERMADFKLIIFNDKDYKMSDDQFKQFVETANEYQVSIIFPSQWGSGTIGELRDAFGDPTTVKSDFEDHSINVKITQEHPIFKGYQVGDEVKILVRDKYSQQYSVYEGYSGTTIGSLTHDDVGVLGDGIGYKFSSANSVHVLLSGLHAGNYGEPADRWTEDAKQIYLNAIDYALSASQGEIRGTVKNEAGEAIPNAKVSIQGTNLQTTTSSDGSYSFGVGTGNYSIKVQARGYMEQVKDVTLSELGETTSLDFSLIAIEGVKVSGKVTDAVTNEELAGAKVTITPEDPEGFVDEMVTTESGAYEFGDLLPGVYDISISLDGYMPTTTKVTVEDKDVVLDIPIHAYEVAVIGDINDALETFLNENQMYAEARDWDVLNDIGNYQLILVNTNKGTNEQVKQLIEESDTQQVSLVFVGTWGLKDGSIQLLEAAEGYPQHDQQGYNEGAVYLNPITDHPIFDGLDASGPIKIHAEKSPYATFKDYQGINLANLSMDETDKGNAIAYQYRGKTHMHLLLSSFAVTNIIGPDYGWTEQGKQIFINALKWAKDAEQAVPTAPTWDQDEWKFNNQPVVVSGTAEPGAFVHIYNVKANKKAEIVTVQANWNGAFEAELNVENGSYFLELEAENFAGKIAGIKNVHLVVSGKPNKK